MMLFLDIALRNVGWALCRSDGQVIKCGVIHTAKDDNAKKTEDLFRRAGEIASELKGIWVESTLDGRIAKVVCEAMSWPRDASSAVAMAIAWGSIAGVLDEHEIEIKFVATQSAKRKFAGKRDADKKDVANGVANYYKDTFADNLDRHLLHLKNAEKEHVYDALAAGYTEMEKCKSPKKSRSSTKAKAT